MTESISVKAQAARLLGEGKGETAISTALGITRHRARALVFELTKTKASPGTSLAEIEPRTAPEFAERITACWHRSREAYVEAGRLLCAAKASLDHGEFQAMVETLPFKIRKAEMLMAIYRDQRLVNPQYVAALPNELGTLYDLTRVKDKKFEAAIESGAISPEMEREEVKAVLKPGPSRSMNRTEAADSLDPFWTPPWATRALMERVLPQLGMHPKGHTEQRIWEPACGEGHMSQVLMEYSDLVYASDIHRYGENAIKDFLTCEIDVPGKYDWIITNPPFRGDLAERFVLRALDLAYQGAAMFVALQFLESTGRFDRIFKDRPPTLISFFAERVNCCKGRWDPDGSTDAAYVWLVWHKDRAPQAPYWIPPGQRKGLTKDDDRARFAAWSMKSEAAE